MELGLMPLPDQYKSMGLSTIQCANEKKTHARSNPTGLKVEDIPGAQVGTTGALRKMKFTNKPNVPPEIQGASPRLRIPKVVQRPNHFNLSNQDIELSVPQPHSFVTNRHTDPINPKYALPSFMDKPVTPPKQLHDTMRVDDIAGTKPRPLRRDFMKDPMDVSDIRGTHAGSTRQAQAHQKFRASTLDSEAVKQINFEGTGLRSTRMVDPLSPRYVFDKPANAADWSIGDIDGNHPRALPRQKGVDAASLSLRTRDIDGAQSCINMPRPHQRRQWGNTTDISDIQRAAPSTKHTGFHAVSSRHLDPLNPEYRPIGWRKAIPEADRVAASRPF